MEFRAFKITEASFVLEVRVIYKKENTIRLQKKKKNTHNHTLMSNIEHRIESISYQLVYWLKTNFRQLKIRNDMQVILRLF